VKSLLTTFGNGQVNVNTASDSVLAMTGCPRTLSDKLRFLRSSAAAASGSSGSRCLESIHTMLADLFRHGRALNDAETNYLKTMISYHLLTTRSQNFSYHIVCRHIAEGRTCHLCRTIRRPANGPLTDEQTILWE